MNRLPILRTALAALFLLVCAPAYAERAITIGYQGIIESKGEFPDGITARMKFALCDKDCATAYWSNDQTSVAGTEPTSAVSVPVVGGVFNVLLGDSTLMESIPSSVFDQVGDKDLYLRVWFDDSTNGSELLTPDQRVSLVPFSVRTISGNTTGNLAVTTTATGTADGVVFNAASVTGGTAVLVQIGNLTSTGLAFQIEDPTKTIFSVNEDGQTFARGLVLDPLTSASEISQILSGRFFYDGTTKEFKACNDTSCSVVELAGVGGAGDIASVTAGTGLTGGGTSGAVTLSLDTSVAVTKTGNHTMAGTLSTAGLTGTTVTSSSTMNTTDLTATGSITGGTLTATSTATPSTTRHIAMSPTGAGVGNTAELRLLELAANGVNYVGFKGPDLMVGDRIWTLPAADGTAGQILSTNGSGVLSWVADANAGGDIVEVRTGTLSGLTGGVLTGVADVSVVVESLGGLRIPGATGLQLDHTATLATDPSLAARRIIFDATDAQGGLLFEGATPNGFETLLTVAEPTADRTFTLPDVADGTIALTTSNVATATALAADPANCAASNVAAGVTANGTAEGCVSFTSANTASAIVSRDGSGNFSAGTVTAGGLTLGTSGTNMTRHLSAAFSLNLGTPGAVPGCVESAAQALANVALGDTVVASMNVALPASYTLQGYVSSAGNVIVRMCQLAGAAADPDGAGATYRVDAWQH